MSRNIFSLLCGAAFAPVLFLCSDIALAVAKNDMSCAPLKVIVKNNSIVLNEKAKQSQATIFFIKNISQGTIQLDHSEGKDPHASAGWSSSLQPNNWSALLLDKNDFALNCATLNNGKINRIDCVKAIEVCTIATFSQMHEDGSYWVVEDNAWDETLKTVQTRLKKN